MMREREERLRCGWCDVELDLRDGLDAAWKRHEHTEEGIALRVRAELECAREERRDED